jgi:hypothetical protein
VGIFEGGSQPEFDVFKTVKTAKFVDFVILLPLGTNQILNVIVCYEDWAVGKVGYLFHSETNKGSVSHALDNVKGRGGDRKEEGTGWMDRTRWMHTQHSTLNTFQLDLRKKANVNSIIAHRFSFGSPTSTP